MAYVTYGMRKKMAADAFEKRHEAAMIAWRKADDQVRAQIGREMEEKFPTITAENAGKAIAFQQKRREELIAPANAALMAAIGKDRP